MAKKQGQQQTQEQSADQGEATQATKATRQKRETLPMQLRKLPPADSQAEVLGSDLGIFVTNVKDVGAAKKYLRKNPTDDKYIVVGIKATLTPKTATVTRVTF